MFSRVQQITWVLFGLLAVLSYGRVGGNFLSPRETGQGPWLGRRGLEASRRDIVKREVGLAHGRGVCSSNAPAGDQPSKRDVHQIFKRSLAPFPPDPAEQNQFMVDHTEAATSIIAQPDRGDRDINTAFFRSLPADSGLGLEVSNLKGCGVVVVASKKAVYFAHFWELESFPAELGEDETPVDDFDGRVTKLLDEGLDDSADFDNPPPQFQEGIKPHIDDFLGVDNLQAYLVMSQYDETLPDPDDADKQDKVLYQKSMDTMAAQIKDLIGVDPIQRTYRVDGTGDRDLSAVAEGKILYEYDPKGGNGDPGFRVIIEREEFFTQTVVKQADCVCDEDSCNFSCCADGGCAA